TTSCAERDRRIRPANPTRSVAPTGSSRSPSPAPPLLREQRPALVVSPAAADLEIAARQPFPPETRAPHEGERRHVARLDVRLYAVEPKPAERDTQGKL